MAAMDSLARLLLVTWMSALLLMSCSVRARNIGEQSRYDTAYACEGSTLTLECKEGEKIHLLRANFGRFSITICNDNGNTEWSVNCMSPRSLPVLHKACSDKPNCSILASTRLFGEPCPGTRKYLEAHYQCLPAATTTTTSRPSPPLLMTSQASEWITAKLPSLRPVHKLEATTSSSSTVSTSSPPVQPPTAPPPPPPAPQPPAPKQPITVHDQEPPELVVPTETTTIAITTTTPALPAWKSSRRTTVATTPLPDYNPSPSVSWVQETDLVQNCAPATARNLNWNWTYIGETATQSCPGGATGQARWHCENSVGQGVSKASWQPATPDLSECRSVWLTSLESRIKEGDSIISIADDLSQVTSSKMLYGGDMMTTTKIIKKMAQKISNDIQTFPDSRQREAIVTELLHKVVLTSSNLLDNSQHPSWRDLSYAEQMRVATSLLTGLEENAFLLADTVVVEKTVVEKVKNILLSVRVVETRNIGTEQFPSSDTWEGGDWLQLPSGALVDNSEAGFVRLVFVAFERLEEILQPQVIEEDIRHNYTRVLNSKVISASLGKGRHIQLPEPVHLCLRHLRVENVSNPSCVFWNYETSTWSEEGCEVESSNVTHTLCKCDHLTNFAVLMDVHATLLLPVHQTALQIITYVGCIISIVCLILAIITFQLFRGLKSDRTTIHKNLCFCLLIAEVLFLAGIGQTDKPVLCGIVAGFLHFFFLCAFAWMFLEGFQLYVMLIEVFEAEKPRIRWYYMFAYGAPLIIVAVSCVVDPLSYGTDRYCWLRADNFFIFSFVGPVILVILANLVFLSMAIYKMCRHTSTSVPVKSKEHARLASASGKEENAHSNKIQSNLAWLRGAIVLVFLLGLTWTFGLLYLNQESVMMAYVFTVLNSLQGLFIFVFHCVHNEKVHKEYRKFIRRNSWLPKCLGCSKVSSPGKEQNSSLYAGSSPCAPNCSHSTDSSCALHGTSYILQRQWSTRAKPTLSGSSCDPPTTSIPCQQEVEKISFKSYSRDSGHGGSEQEESPRSLNTTTLSNNLRCLNKDSRRPPHYQANDLRVEACLDIPSPQMLLHQQVAAAVAQHHHYLSHGRAPKKLNGRSASPWNHTYTEIREGRMLGDDPVYEEIERGEIQMSDMSDEDGRRQSDMSRQSSRSYSDHRPLIAYDSMLRHYQAAMHALGEEEAADVVGYPYLPDNMRTVAFLEGDSVVCHVHPEHTHNPYATRTVLLSPYSEC